jgi:hypothetical protein
LRFAEPIAGTAEHSGNAASQVPISRFYFQNSRLFEPLTPIVD